MPGRYLVAVPWLIKALLLAAKSRRGRRLLVAGVVGAFELSRSAKARKVYAKTWRAAQAGAARAKGVATTTRPSGRRA